MADIDLGFDDLAGFDSVGNTSDVDSFAAVGDTRDLFNFGTITGKTAAQANKVIEKADKVMNATARKAAAFNPLPQSDTLGSEEEFILRNNPSPEQLEQFRLLKQEQELDKRIDANLEEQMYQEAFRHGGDTARDMGLAVTKGLVDIGSTIYGVTDLVTPGDLDAGTESIFGRAGSQILRDAREFWGELQTEQAQLERDETQLRNEQYDVRKQERINARMQEGDSEFYANVKEQGGQFVEAIKNLSDNPIEAGDLVFASVPQLLASGAVGKVAKGIASANIRGKSAKAAERFLQSKAGQDHIRKVATSANLGYVGLSEGMSNGLQAKAEVLDRSESELSQSPDYQAYRNKGLSHEDARMALADDVFDIVAAASGIIGVGASKFTGAAEITGNLFNGVPTRQLFKGIIGRAATGALSEGVEETIQSSGGAVAGNLGNILKVEADQTLDSRIIDESGRAAAAGLVAGSLSGGAIAAPTGVRGSLENVRGAALAIKDKASGKPVITDPTQEGYAANTALIATLDNIPENKDGPEYAEFIEALSTHANNIFEVDVPKVQGELNAAYESGDVGRIKRAEAAADQQLNETKDLIKRAKVFIDEAKNKEVGVDVTTNPTQVIDAEDSTPEQVEAASDFILRSGPINTDNTANLEKIANSEKVLPAQRQAAQKMLAVSQAINAPVEGTDKSLNEVNSDIIEGGKGFLGIKDHNTIIGNAIASGNIPAATKALQTMQNFVQSQIDKRDLLRNIRDGIASGSDVTTLVNQYNKQFPSPSGQPFNFTSNTFSGAYLPTIEAEVNALELALDANQSYLQTVPGVEAPVSQSKPVSTEATQTVKQPAATSTVPVPERLQSRLESAIANGASRADIDRALNNTTSFTDEEVEAARAFVDTIFQDQTAQAPESFDQPTQGEIPAEVDDRNPPPIEDDFIPEEQIAQEAVSDQDLQETEKAIKDGDTFTYKGVTVIWDSSIKANTGEPGAAKRVGNTIYLHPELMPQKFAEKAWTNSRTQTDSSKTVPLPADIFPTYEAFQEFVLEHEYQHTLLSGKEWRTAANSADAKVADYENEINHRALTKLGYDVSGINIPSIPLETPTQQTEEVVTGAEQSQKGTLRFDKVLGKKIETILKKLYPEIQLKYTNTPITPGGEGVFNQQADIDNSVEYTLKAINILNSNRAVQVFNKGKKNNWEIGKILSELQIPKLQQQLIRDLPSLTSFDPKLLSSELAASYSQPVELTSGSDKETFYDDLTVPGGTDYKEIEISTPFITPVIKGHAEFSTSKGIGWYRTDELIETIEPVVSEKIEEFIPVPQENRLPKVRRILEMQSDLFQKGRDLKDLLKDDNLDENTLQRFTFEDGTIVELRNDGKDYGTKYWFDTDYDIDTGKVIVEEFSKKLTKQEHEKLVESDLAFIVEDITEGRKEANNFLQLLNKDNNWVNFFLQAIIQDSAKQGFEKVIFPTAQTIAKIEGFEEEAYMTDNVQFILRQKKNTENKISEIEAKISTTTSKLDKAVQQENLVEAKKELAAWERNLKEEVNNFNENKELSGTEQFYKNNIPNALKKIVGKSNVKAITDEFGNTWNEITLNTSRDLSPVMLQKDKDLIIGQANIKAGTVLIDAINQKQDTLPHEYAHHYIAWFRDTPLVQEGIKRFGSEEALVQAIGEQAVIQKGQAYNWWRKFTDWLLNKASDKEVLELLTDAFLTRKDLNNIIETPLQEEPASEAPSEGAAVAQEAGTSQATSVEGIKSEDIAGGAYDGAIEKYFTVKPQGEKLSELTDNSDSIQALENEQRRYFDRMRGFLDEFTSMFSGLHDYTDQGEQPIKRGEVFTVFRNPSLLLADKDGNFSQDFIDRLGVAALKWLSITGNSTISNDDGSIRAVLGLDDGDPIRVDQLLALRRAGIPFNQLAEQIGREAMKAMGIKARNDQSRHNDAAMAWSLGNRALTALAKAGAIEIKQVPGNVFEGATEANPNNNRLKAVNFVRVKTNMDNFGNETPVQDILDFGDAYSITANRELMESLVGLEKDLTFPTPNKPKKTGKQIRNTTQHASAKQRDIVDESQERPYRIKENVAAIFLALSDEAQRIISGHIPVKKKRNSKGEIVIDAKATGRHISEIEGIDANNNAIDKQIRDFKNFLADESSRNEDGSFYIGQRIWKTLRMGMEGAINPQASWVHRILLGVDDTTVSIQKNTDSEKLFKLSVLEAMGEKIHKHNLSANVKRFNELVTKQSIQDALTEIQKLQEGQQADEQKILNAIAGKEGIWTFDALIAVNEWQNTPEGGTFETNLFREVDGITNGVIIGLIQFSGAKNINELMRQLNKGGVFRDQDGYRSANHYFSTQGNTDQYETLSVGINAWFNNAINNAPNQGIKEQLIAVRRIANASVGQNGDDIIARNLSKQPLMTIFYGAGIPGVIRALAGDVLQNTYKRMAEIGQIQDPQQRKEASKQLQNEIEAVIGMPLVFTGDNLFEVRLAPDQERIFLEVFQDVYGEALKTTIESLFPTFMEHRQMFNDVISLAFDTFKTELQRNVDQREKSLGRGLSEKELIEEIDALEEIAPIINSYFGQSLKEGLLFIKQNPIRRQTDDKGKVIKHADAVGQPPGYGQVRYSENAKIPIVGVDGKVTEQHTIAGMPSEIGFADPGVAGGVIGVHQLDAAIMMQLIEQMAILNVHDAAGIPVTQNAEAGQGLNKAFLDTMQNYNLLNEAAKLLGRVAAHIDTTANEELIKRKDNLLNKFEPVAIKNDEIQGDLFGPEGITRVDNYNTQTIDGVYVNTLASPITEDNVDDLVSDILAELDDGDSYGSANEGIDEELFKGKKANKLTSESTIEVFDSLETMGNVEENPNHSKHLRGVLQNVVVNVLGPWDVMVAEGGTHNIGLADMKNKVTKIQLGLTHGSKRLFASGLRMSAQEVFAHEMVHATTAHAINSDSHAARQLKRLFDYVEKHGDVSATDFMNQVDGDLANSQGIKFKDMLENETDRIEDLPEYQDELADAQARYDYIFNNTDTQRDKASYLGKQSVAERNPYLQEFMAIGLTNENFMRKLATIKVSQDKLHEQDDNNTLLRQLRNLYDYMMQKIFGQIQREKTTASAELYALATELSAIQQRKENLALDAVDTINGKVRQLVDWVVEGFQDLLVGDTPQETTGESTRGILQNIRNIGRNIPQISREGFDITRREALNKNQRVQTSFFNNITDEIQGPAEQHKKLDNKTRVAKNATDHAAVHRAQNVGEVLLSQFGTTPEKHSRIALTQSGIKTDVATLLDNGYSLDQIEQFSRSVRAREKAIQELRSQISEQFPEQQYWLIKQARSLGNFMATGRPTEKVPYLNAENIVNMEENPYLTRPQKNIQEAIKLVDNLASLEAINATDKWANREFARLIRDERNGVEFMLAHHSTVKRDSLNYLFDGQSRMMIKGYAPELINGEISFQVATEEDGVQLEKLGYEKQPNKLRRDNDEDPNKPDLFIYVSPFGQLNTLDTGLVSYANMTAKGTNMYNDHLTSGSENPSANAMEDFNTVKLKKIKAMKDISQPGDSSIGGDNVLIPVVRQDGKIVDFRYMMSEENKRKLLQKDESFDTVLGQMDANLIRKIEGRKNNEEAVKLAKEEYDKYFKDEPNAWIKVSKDSPDPNAREVWAMLPREMKKNIKEEWGENAMYVHQAAWKTMFGQRRIGAASRTQIDTEGLEGFEQMKAEINNIITDMVHSKYGLYLEGTWQDIVKYAKDTIVIRSVETLVFNIASNQVSLMLLGLGPVEAAKLQIEAFNDAKEYQKVSAELDKLTITLRNKGIDPTKDKFVDRLKNQLATNKVHRLFEAGVYQSITDDIYTLDDDNKTRGLVQRLAQPVTDKIPLSARKALNIAALNHGTPIYDGLRDLTQLSDFMARYALHTKNIRDGMSFEDSIDDIVETFINYDQPTDPRLQYSNDMGLFMFTKYKLRDQRIIYKVGKKRPASAALLLILQNVTGIGINSLFDANMVMNRPYVNSPYDIVEGAITMHPLYYLYDRLFR